MSAKRTSAFSTRLIRLLAHTTISRDFRTGNFCLNVSLIRRLIKFLEAAAGIRFLLTEIPSLANPHSLSSTNITNHLLPRPFFRKAWSNTLLCPMRRQEGKDCPVSDSKSRTAFGPASIDYSTPTFRLHPYQESMSTFSFGN